MMTDLVQNGRTNFADEVGLVLADRFDVFLKDVHTVRQVPGIQHASLGPRPSLLEPHQQFVGGKSDTYQLRR